MRQPTRYYPAMGAIAENLKRMRLAAGLSQPELARRAKVSQQLISQIENSANSSTKHLPALAKALGVKVDDLDPNYHFADKNATEAPLATDSEEEIRVLFTFLGGEPSPADLELFRRLAASSPQQRRGLLAFLRNGQGEESDNKE